MGSLKDEMRGLREDCQPCEKTDDGGHPVGSDCSAAAEGHPLHTSQESMTQEDYQQKIDMNVNSVERRDKNLMPKDQVLSGVDCDNTAQCDCNQVKNCTQTDAMPLTPQTQAHETMTSQNDTTITISFPRDEDPADINVLNTGKEAGIEKILVPVPSTPGPSDPRSPAPFGQQHMRTQVSLEVVQCCSAATSPMTPPEGSHSFFFPSTFGKSGATNADTKDAELQVGQQVEFCSVATSPMTPKTPSTTAFPELIGTETVQKEEQEKKRDKQKESVQQEGFTEMKSPAEVELEITRAFKFATSKETAEGFSSTMSLECSENCLAAEVKDSQVTLEDRNQQGKQQRMGSLDQDITILVTDYGNNEGEEDEKPESYFQSIEPEMGKIDEYEEVGENNSNIKREDEKGNTAMETPVPVQDTSNMSYPQRQAEDINVCVEAEGSDVTINKDACEKLTKVSVTKPPVPESPAPFGCHNIRTQVSLDVVQCQSAATSPMTPPEGDQAFYFPSSFGKCTAVSAETKDAELQVGTQVEFRSVATAPMTPRTPVATTFPEIKKELSIEEKIVEVEEDKKEQLKEECKEVEEDKEEVINCKEKSEEKCEEPVQEVSWDEKGMTWEVYGAVVEVAVLGSAIQKHLEKQVLKQKKQSSMPPPPPLNPSATPLTLEAAQGGSGKGRAGKIGKRDGKVRRRRRNPFRLLMENMQQPHCCSRAHTTE
ncbi:uncharacterized protein LOC121643712 [Melanotaenia boesemani]|uniref:uncharacterized protein LOC121643712 n=1 Tax=Melanotaenia boesemani TaxID=1250792 RepID=UPI001C0429A5|nr:uncharacterized protein LOC121643712 [Melanotaenia boesemani]